VKLNPRPLMAARGGGGNIGELLEIRRRLASNYWAAEFAPLFKPGVS
jgi:hypothetical protein